MAAKKEKERGKSDEEKGKLDEESKNRAEREEREAKNKLEISRKAISRGHSTPEEVGKFAGQIRARRIVVNHFSAMYVQSPTYKLSHC